MSRWGRSRNWEPEFFDAYGVDPDLLRIDCYRRLWQASDTTPASAPD
jgi:kanamycin kinase